MPEQSIPSEYRGGVDDPKVPGETGVSDVPAGGEDFDGAEEIWSELEGGDDETDDVGPVRRHALWALLVLFFAAAIAGSLMVLLGGGGGHHRQAIIHVPVNSTAVPTTTPATPATTPLSSSTQQQTTSASARHAPALVVAGTSLPASPGARGNPCNRASSCLVPGDGGAVAAVNDFRTHHHLSPVRGMVTSDAQRCAQTTGGGATCVPHYAYTVLRWQDGATAVDKVNSFNPGWLTDPDIKRIQIGWWYTGGSYNFAILKSP